MGALRARTSPQYVQMCPCDASHWEFILRTTGRTAVKAQKKKVSWLQQEQPAVIRVADTYTIEKVTFEGGRLFDFDKVAGRGWNVSPHPSLLKAAASLHQSVLEPYESDTMAVICAAAAADDDGDEPDDGLGGTTKRARAPAPDKLQLVFDDVQATLYLRIVFSRKPLSDLGPRSDHVAGDLPSTAPASSTMRPPPSPEPGFLEWGFRQQWKDLVQKGWRARQGTGLVDWYYVRPGANHKTGALDVDYFTSPEALQRFLVSHAVDLESGRVGAISEDPN